MSAAALLAAVGFAARVSHPGGGASSTSNGLTTNLTQFGLEDDWDDDFGEEGFGQGSFLAPSTGPPGASTGTS